MIEVLITVIIIAFAILGMAGMHARMQSAEMESYQRSQAILLLQDIANRIAINRNNASSYVTGVDNPLGANMTCPSSTSTTAAKDLKEWCEALQGAAETAGSSQVGAMIGGRGCVESTSVAGEYFVTVAWQGLTPISPPPDSVACGLNNYNSSGTPCVSDRCRRTVTTLVRIASLS